LVISIRRGSTPRAARVGADAVTVPYSVLEQMERYPLTDRGIAQFLEDAKKTSR